MYLHAHTRKPQPASQPAARGQASGRQGAQGSQAGVLRLAKMTDIIVPQNTHVVPTLSRRLIFSRKKRGATIALKSRETAPSAETRDRSANAKDKVSRIISRITSVKPTAQCAALCVRSGQWGSGVT